jgi:hypothetical protein
MEREPPLAAVLPRQPGTKESRYAHLLSGEVEAAAFIEAPKSSNVVPFPEQNSRLVQLEAAVEELKREVAILNKRIDDLFGD